VSNDPAPSDAPALALCVDCAISEKSTSEELRKWLEGLSDKDLGRDKM
jgi:hypothetical protein